jgi:hypothetical protein
MDQRQMDGFRKRASSDFRDHVLELNAGPS